MDSAPLFASDKMLALANEGFVLAYSIAPHVVEVSVFDNGTFLARASFIGDEVAVSQDAYLICPP